MAHNHPTVTVKHPEFGDVAIDESLAPLIKQLWRLGIDTEQSCQEEQRGFASVTFPSPAEVAEFLSLGVRQHQFAAYAETWDESDDLDGSAWACRLIVLFRTVDVEAITETLKKVRRRKAS